MLTLDAVRAQLAERLYLEPGELTDDADLFAEGLDSVTIVDLVEEWREGGAAVSFADLAEQPTLRAWWDLLSGTGAEDA
ncbi:phosphopantetheine-binding protein [Lentzea sp. JNUCC 0626]|uniref:phosphopantetheine-binding protein n=1 Tax=Lentzea sp. JNUCC 0626 TaxID=3367513 RepID=UPI00374A1F98